MKTVLRIETDRDISEYGSKLARNLGDAEVSVLSNGLEIIGNVRTLRAVEHEARAKFPDATITLTEEAD
ncbi:MAG TPA: hypothetical protein VJN91_03350 [Gammaproteobacteria bacterium]|nr:hypothetical protein [Gammaproteobacteria bacterium]